MHRIILAYLPLKGSNKNRSTFFDFIFDTAAAEVHLPYQNRKNKHVFVAAQPVVVLGLFLCHFAAFSAK
jgi:hypothetical protein